MIRNQNEEKLFEANVDLSHWTEDSYPNPALAGIPTSVGKLVSEHHARLHRALDEELRNPAEA